MSNSLLSGKQSYTALGIAAALMLVLAIVCVNMCSTSQDVSNTSSADALTLSTEQVKELEERQAEGLVRIESNLNQAYVSPEFWAAMNAQQKEDFAAAIAIRCANMKGTDAHWAEILDGQSGKKLAKWSRSYGFSVY